MEMDGSEKYICINRTLLGRSSFARHNWTLQICLLSRGCLVNMDLLQIGVERVKNDMIPTKRMFTEHMALGFRTTNSYMNVITSFFEAPLYYILILRVIFEYQNRGNMTHSFLRVSSFDYIKKYQEGTVSSLKHLKMQTLTLSLA